MTHDTGIHITNFYIIFILCICVVHHISYKHASCRQYMNEFNNTVRAYIKVKIKNLTEICIENGKVYTPDNGPLHTMYRRNPNVNNVPVPFGNCNSAINTI